ncbi:DUF421 domain-containing protein [Roseiconus lacunae]|uniref:DUF421 domain-containing protein n=1 Tax=Roseiconus lacunae TaxID=2605694 RepID=UPI0011F2BFCA|nr:YetF domain-containing protein [Roseiconus lacunae]
MPESIDTWFNTWSRIESVAISAVFFYVLVIVVVRISGKRLTSQMNNFDWIVTIAIGSLVGSGILLKDVSVADSTAAILILAALQWITTFAVRRSNAFRKVIKPRPTLLTHKGEFIEENLSKERISEAEIRAKLRQQGFTSVEDANWVILETDGSLTVIPREAVSLNEADLMSDVAAPARLGRGQE